MLTRTLWYLQKGLKTGFKALYLLGLIILEHIYRRYCSERGKKTFQERSLNVNLTFNWIGSRSRSLFLILWNVFSPKLCPVALTFRML